MVKVTVCVPAVGFVLAALTATLNVPAKVGVPEISPAALMLKPVGKTDAAKVMGLLVAVI